MPVEKRQAASALHMSLHFNARLHGERERTEALPMDSPMESKEA